MNRALWAATIGGYLAKIIPSALPASLDQALRRFFLDHVTGRGTIPAIRVGRQPYGVLLTSAFGRWQASEEESRIDRLFTATLLKVMGTAYQFWRGLATAVPHVGLDDPDHSAFMSVVGLQASSALYGARKGVTDVTAWNWLMFDGRFAAFAQPVWDALRSGRLQALTRLGFDVSQPDLKLAQIAFLSRFEPLDGPVIDGDPDLPLSEKATITPFDPATKRNYIDWLATSEPEVIKAETFKLADGTTAPVPKALLYKYLRHALLSDASSSALAIAKIRIPALAAMAVIPPEPDIVNVGATHVLTAPQMMGLNASALGLTRNDRSLGGYVLDKARNRLFAADDPPELIVTADLVAALQQLAGLPTARLERLFAEHVDLDQPSAGRLGHRPVRPAAPRPSRRRGAGARRLYRRLWLCRGSQAEARTAGSGRARHAAARAQGRCADRDARVEWRLRARAVADARRHRRGAPQRLSQPCRARATPTRCR